MVKKGAGADHPDHLPHQLVVGSLGAANQIVSPINGSSSNQRFKQLASVQPLSRSLVRNKPDPPTGKCALRSLKEDSIKRVEFSRSHQLREIKRDGTFKDRLANSDQLGDSGSSSSITSAIIGSRDAYLVNLKSANCSATTSPTLTPPIVDSYIPTLSNAAPVTASCYLPSSSITVPRIHSPYSPIAPLTTSLNVASFIPTTPPLPVAPYLPTTSALPTAPSLLTNFHSKSPPCTPPPSISNSTTEFHLISPPSSRSTSPSSGQSSLSGSSTSLSRQPLDVRWASHDRKTAHKTSPSLPSHKSSLGRGQRPRPSNLDPHTVTARADYPRTMNHTFLTHSKPKTQPHPNTDGKWATTSDRTLTRQTHEKTQKKVVAEETGATRPDINCQTSDFLLNGSDHQANAGLSPTRADTSHRSLAINLTSPKLPVPFKLPITEDLKEDKIMLKLKEKLKQQRALASSVGSSSTDTSLLNGSSSSGPSSSAASAFPVQPSAGKDLPGQEKPRKIAVSHSPVGYRGFSEVSLECNNSWRLNSGKAAGVKKQVKQPSVQPKRHEIDIVRPVIQQPSPERSRKMNRIIAPGNRQSSKLGSKDMITTSSWRVGQELMKELGLVPGVTSKKDAGQGEGHDDDMTNRTMTLEEGRSQVHPSQTEVIQSDKKADLSDGEGEKTKDLPPPDTTSDTKLVLRDTKTVLAQIKRGNTEDFRLKSPLRPAVKRKAPKTTEPEKQQQPKEKSRHYDQDSVRKFMARQKAERLKKQLEEKLANQKASERKQQVLLELADKQKQAAKVAAASGRGEGERKRKSDGTNKENLGLQEQDDNSTLTDDTEDSTPRDTPVRIEDDVNRQVKRAKDSEVGLNTNQHAHHIMNVTTTLSVPASSSETSVTPGYSQASNGKPVEILGQSLNMGMETILSRFSQVVKQRQSEGAVISHSATSSDRAANGARFQLLDNDVFSAPGNPDLTGLAFSLGTTNSIARTNEERKQAIKATALTLQNRLAEERRKMEGLRTDRHKYDNSDKDFVSRYSKITGDRHDFVVFGSDLPGSHVVVAGSSSPTRLDEAAISIQTAYRSHSARQTQNLEQPDGQKPGQEMRAGQQEKPSAQGDPFSDISDLSSFSEVEVINRSKSAIFHNTSYNRRSRGNGQPGQTETKVYGSPTPATYRPTKHYAWAEPQPDPFSVMSVFTRQNQYLAAGSRQADMPFTANAVTTTTATSSISTPAFVNHFDLKSVKQPVISSTEHTIHGHTPDGQPMVARTRYTRVEAVVRERTDSGRSQASNQKSASKAATVSDSANALSRLTETSVKSEQAGGQASQRSNASDKTLRSSLDSSEYEFKSSKRNNKKIPLMHRNQHKDLDLSHFSDSDPASLTIEKKMDHKADQRSQVESVPSHRPSAARRGELSGRLSPSSLANKFTANLNYLESMEESLRQIIGIERTRSVAMAQQESVSLAHILQSRQLEHRSSVQNLQQKAHMEATEAAQQLEALRVGGHVKLSSKGPETRSSQPEAGSYSTSATEHFKTRLTEQSVSHTTDSRLTSSITTASIANKSAVSVTTGEEQDVSERIQEHIPSEVSSLSQTISHSSSVPEEVVDEDDSYSLSFDESFTEVLPSESHRREVRRLSGEFQGPGSQQQLETWSQATPHRDLGSLFAEDSFNRFTADMVRLIMNGEERFAHHRAALLSLREKAVKEKAKAELAWLQQLKQKLRNKAADDLFPNVDKRQKKIKAHLKQQKAEIRRVQEANKMASIERRRFLQEHEEFSRSRVNSQKSLKMTSATEKRRHSSTLPESQIQTEDEIDSTSNVNEVKDYKSDSEVYRETSSPGRQRRQIGPGVEKQQKLRLDEKFMTAREQKLHERQKKAKELLEWKKRLDAEEERVFRLEKKAIEAWERKNKENLTGETMLTNKSKDEATILKAPKQISSLKQDESNPVSGVRSKPGDMNSTVSEAVPTQISLTEKSGGLKTEMSASKVIRRNQSSLGSRDKNLSPLASGSEGSIPEEIPSAVSADKQVADSSDDTLINSSVNEDYVDTFEADGSSAPTSSQKSRRLVLPGSSPLLPSPWSRKTGSESESEDSISHTETTSDLSDYEVRIRQLSDQLRRRRKEIEILKKERARRRKEKFKAQEEAMQKQLEVYNKCIQQLKEDKEDLEHEAHHKTAVRPQIKQPKNGGHVKTQHTHHSEAGASTSFEDSTDSNQTSPSPNGKDTSVESPEDKVFVRRRLPVSHLDQLVEASESHSDNSHKHEATRAMRTEGSLGSQENAPSASVTENIEELSHVDSNISEENAPSASVTENIEELSHVESNISDQSSSVTMNIPMTASLGTDQRTEEIETQVEESYSLDFLHDKHSSIGEVGSRRSEMTSAAVQKNTRDEVTEFLEENASTQSQSVASVKQRQLTEEVPVPAADSMLPGSDSDTESRVISNQASAKSQASSRPSSEHSLGSISYSPEDEEDIISYESDKLPSQPQKNLPASAVSATEEMISEHISASLPSISEKHHSQDAALRYQQSKEMLDSILDYQEEDEADQTPVATPRDMLSTPVPDEGSEIASPLVKDDPLADFSIGDRVLVGGCKLGTLRFKGKVDFSPGIWAGVELINKEGDCNGLHEGRQYFTCPAGHGLMVAGSDITFVQPASDVSEISEDISVSEPLTAGQDKSLLADFVTGEIFGKPSADISVFHSPPLAFSDVPDTNGSVPNSADFTGKNGAVSARNLAQIADNITNHLTASLIEDSIKTVQHILSRKSPYLAVKTSTTSTLPSENNKEGKYVVLESKSVERTDFVLQNQNSLTDTSLIKTAPSQQPSVADITPSLQPRVTDLTKLQHLVSALNIDAATDGVMKSMLKEAISDILTVKKRRSAITSASQEVIGQSTKLSLEDGTHGDEDPNADDDSGLSLDPFQRPNSPLPGDSGTSRDHRQLEEDLMELFGEYIEDDLGFGQQDSSPGPPPPYPLAPEKPVVPHTREEIAPLVSKAVDIYWQRRRFGESLENVVVPAEFLDEPLPENSRDPLTEKSLKSWRWMIFDLTGEIVRDVYQSDSKPDIQAWQKTKHKPQKFFRGHIPPTTVEKLQPLVQTAVFQLLGVSGSRKYNTVNKWNIRKRKDPVDSILTQELNEEELGWVDYDNDELNLKLSLADSIFDSLLVETVQTLNEIFQKKQES